MHLIPGDPAEAMVPPEAPYSAIEKLQHELGLDRPLHVQYFAYLSHVIRGDFGKSIVRKVPVLQEIGSRFPATMQLSVAAMLVAVVVGFPAGIVAALKRNSLVDHVCMLFSWIGTAMPAFLLGLLLMLVFGVRLKWLPILGRGGIRHLILPAVTLGTYSTAVIARMLRASILEILSKDYITTARAKGLNSAIVVSKHILKNALIPTLTDVGLQMGYMLGGAVVTETIFAWPGTGRLFFDAAADTDTPVLMGILIIISIFVVVFQILTDVSYAWLDPRIRYD